MGKKLVVVAVVLLLLGMAAAAGAGVAEKNVELVESSEAATTGEPTGWEQMLGPLLDKVKILRVNFLGNELWQYGICLLIVFLSLTAAKLLEYFLREKVRKLTEKTRSRLDDIAVRTMSGPLKLIIVVIGIRLSSTVFHVSDKMQKALGSVFEVLIAVVIGYAILKTVDAFIAYLEPRVKESASKLDDQLLPILGKTVKISVIVIGGMVVVQNLGYNVTGLLTGLGIGGLALAMAAKDSLSNLFGAIALFTDRPFQVGDRVIVDGCDGPVESVGLRSTRIRTLDGTLVTIPNSRMANAVINNIAKRPTIKNLYTLGVTYDTGHGKIGKALEIVRDIYRGHPSTDNYWVYFKEFGAHSLNILVIHWCKYLAYEEFLKATEEINMEIMKRFEANAIEIAFPTQTLYLKKEGKSVDS